MIQQVITRSDRGEHLPYRETGRIHVAGSLGSSADYGGLGDLGHGRHWASYFRFFFLVLLFFFARGPDADFLNSLAMRSTCSTWFTSCPANMRARCATVSLPRSRCMP